MSRKKGIVFHKILIAACIILAAGAIIFLRTDRAAAAVASEGKVYLENIDVTGMNQEEVQAVIDRKMEQYRQDIIEVFVGDRTAQIEAGAFGLYYANTDLAAVISSIGLNGNVLSRYRIENYIRDNGAVFFSLDLRVTVENTSEVINDRLTALNKAPVNMKLGRDAEGAFFTVPKEDGFHILPEETLASIVEYLCTSWHGGYGGVRAVTVTDEAVGMPGDDISLVTSVLGTGSTQYETTGKYASRAANIANATAKISGTIVYPGEEFSTEAAMVPFTLENGYSYAATYENNEVVDDIGGGICQVSSTLYRAVLEAELEVTERYQHSMKVGYVEPSMDATIAENSLDFKFVNTTDAPIYIEGSAENGTVTFTIFGHETRPAGHSIGFESEITEYEEATTVYVLDPNMDYGAIDFVDPHDGLSARAYKITYQDGVEVAREHISSSYYVKSDGRCIIGTRNAPEGIVSALQVAAENKNLGEVYLLIGLDVYGGTDGTTYSPSDAIDYVYINEGLVSGEGEQEQNPEQAAAEQAAAEQAAAEQAAAEAEQAGTEGEGA